MKKIIGVLLIAFTGFVLTACGSNSSNDRIEIDFWHMSPVGSDGFTEMRAIINTFNESQDRILVNGTGFSFWDYWDKINIAISSRTAPDIGFHTIDDMVLRAEAGVLYNISELNEGESIMAPIEIDQFRTNQLEFLTYADNLYALPFTATTRVLYYNIDMFNELGYDASDVPQTWSELEALAKQFDQVEDGDIVRLGFDPTYGNATYHGWLWQTGEDFFDTDLNPTLNTPTHVEVLDWIVGFNDNFTRNQLNSFGESNQLLGLNVFAAEKVAMIVDTDGLYKILEDSNIDFNYGIAPIPIPEGGERINWGSGFSIEMFNNNRGDDASRDATFEFLQYLMSYDTQIELVQATGWLMSHIQAMEDYVAGNELLTALLNEVDYAVDKVYVDYAPNWHAADWQPFFSKALDRTLTPAQALEQAREFYLEKQENFEVTN